MARYSWASPDSGTIELIDANTGHPVATIIQSDSSHWHWARKTSRRDHGVPPADGVAATLLKAKMAVLQGMPDEAWQTQGSQSIEKPLGE